MGDDLLKRIGEVVQMSALQGLLVIDREFKVVFINNTLCKAFKITKEEIMNKPTVDFFFKGNKKRKGGEYYGPLIETMDAMRELTATEYCFTNPRSCSVNWFLVDTFLLRDKDGNVEYALGNYIIIDQFKALESKLNAVNVNVIKAFCKAIGVRDLYTMRHSESVASLLVGLAEYMNLPSDVVTNAYLAGIVHDVGKIGISEHILNKPGRLTDDEYEVIKRHPTKGAEILAEVDGFSLIADIVHYHHERYDGLGYPLGIAKSDIPFISRMLTVCDSYDAMTSERCYHSSLTVEQALQEIKKCSGKQFDPEISSVFIDFIRRCNDNMSVGTCNYSA